MNSQLYEQKKEREHQKVETEQKKETEKNHLLKVKIGKKERQNELSSQSCPPPKKKKDKPKHKTPNKNQTKNKTHHQINSSDPQMFTTSKKRHWWRRNYHCWRTLNSALQQKLWNVSLSKKEWVNLFINSWFFQCQKKIDFFSFEPTDPRRSPLCMKMIPKT